jgi:hypothetical protein
MDLSLRTLKEAVEIRQQIDDLEERLVALFKQPVQPMTTMVAQRRRMPIAAKAGISAATKARRARAPGKHATTARRTANRKSGITSAGRKRLSEMMKARWAARKAKSRGR